MQSERRAKGDAAPERKGRRTVLVDEEVVECAVYARDRLRAGSHLTGPALVEERECTRFVGPDGVATVDEFGAVVVELKGA